VRKHLLTPVIAKRKRIIYVRKHMTRQATITKIIHCDESRFPFTPPYFEKEFRNDQWLSSRGALLLALTDLGIAVKSLEELDIKNHDRLIHFPEVTTSLSHHQKYGAAAVSNESDVISIGIDIEDENRTLKEGTRKYFVHEKDHHRGDDLACWTAKEAAFKAVFPHWIHSKPLVLTDLWIGEKTFGHGEHVLGELSWFECEPGLTGALARLKRKPS
jgi:hypothetical protein